MLLANFSKLSKKLNLNPAETTVGGKQWQSGMVQGQKNTSEHQCMTTCILWIMWCPSCFNPSTWVKNFNDSPALKKWGYTGLALSFSHSFCHSFLPSNYQINFRHTFLKNYKSYKVETWYTHTMWVDVCVYRNQGQELITLGVTSLDRFYNLPLMKFFFTLFSRTVRVTNLKPSIHMDNGLMYYVYRNQGQGPMTGVKSHDRFQILSAVKSFHYRFLTNYER